MKLILMAALAVAVSAHAEEGDLRLSGIGVHTFSVHGSAGFNNVNPGVYLQANYKGEEFVAGTYYNSIRQQSVYAGWTWSGPLHIDWTVGIITGYKRSPLPLVAPSITIDVTESMRARLVLLPNPFEPKDSALHLAVEYRFKE